MTETITFSAEYAGYVGDEKVAWLYRAWAEDGQPYCIVLNEDDGGVLVLTQDPTLHLDDEITEDEGEELDRRNAIRWVEALTELVAKARAFDSIFEYELDELDDTGVFDDDFEDFEDDFEDDEDDEHSAYVVDVLTEAEDDAEWVDSDGDHYRVINGEWCFSAGGYGPWNHLEDDEQYLLTKYGPYQAVR